jgi:hypothetical protein
MSKEMIKILPSSPCALRLCVLCVMIFATWFFPSSLCAFDVGLTLDQNLEYSGSGGDTDFVYKGILIPHVSGLLGDNSEFYVSAGLNYQGVPWVFAPELLRTGIPARPGGLQFALGRSLYSDPLGYVASGLFDGGRLSFETPAGTFSAAAWYTGLLYKKRINIEMTNDEWTANNTAIDYGDFAATYFAPRRVLAALDWEHQGLYDLVLARLSLLGQFDLTKEKLHSQYLAGKMTLPLNNFSFDLGGCFELIEVNDDIGSAFAAEIGLAWRNHIHRLSFEAKYSSGESDSAPAFLPLTTNTQGQILKPRLSGISIISLDYTARLHSTFSVGFTPMYFILTDSESETDGRLLGGEIFAALYWSPAPDISINLGGGAYLPSLGNAAPKENSYWRVELNIILSLF